MTCVYFICSKTELKQIPTFLILPILYNIMFSYRELNMYIICTYLLVGWYAQVVSYQLRSRKNILNLIIKHNIKTLKIYKINLSSLFIELYKIIVRGSHADENIIYPHTKLPTKVYVPNYSFNYFLISNTSSLFPFFTNKNILSLLDKKNIKMKFTMAISKGRLWTNNEAT